MDKNRFWQGLRLVAILVFVVLGIGLVFVGARDLGSLKGLGLMFGGAISLIVALACYNRAYR